MFWDKSLFWLKREFFIEFPQNFFKTTEKHSLALCGVKQFLFIFVQFYCFEQKGLFTINLNLPLDLLFFKLVEKNKLPEYICASFWQSFFLLEREFFSEFTRKCFITTGKHSLVVCGSFWGEKRFLLIFVQFYWCDQKQLFKQIQIFIRICPFTILFRKQTFWVFRCSFLSLFWLKREFFNEFPQKCLKTTEKHILAVCGSFWGEIQFLFVFVQFYCFKQKVLCTNNPNWPLDLLLFKLVEKNKIFEYF